MALPAACLGGFGHLGCQTVLSKHHPSAMVPFSGSGWPELPKRLTVPACPHPGVRGAPSPPSRGANQNQDSSFCIDPHEVSSHPHAVFAGAIDFSSKDATF